MPQSPVVVTAATLGELLDNLARQNEAECWYEQHPQIHIEPVVENGQIVRYTARVRLLADTFHIGDEVLVDSSDFGHTFSAIVVDRSKFPLVTVRDQEDNCWDVRVEHLEEH